MNADGGVAAIVLGAGSGRRFTAAGGRGPKLLAELDGRPLLDHAIDAALEAGLRPVVAVLPPSSPALVAVAELRTGMNVVVNPTASEGLSTSVATGLAALASLQPDQDDGAVGACVLLLADQPAIDPEVLAQVIAAWRRTGRPVRVRYDDGPGHPVLLPRHLWTAVEARLVTADGRARERGAGWLLAELDVVEVRPGVLAPVDVDVPDDLLSVAAAPPDTGTRDE